MMAKKERLLTRLVNELQAEKIVVTGSFALYKLGVTEIKPKDLDIILIKPYESTKDLIKIWNNINKSNIRVSNYPSKVGLQYIVNIDGIEVDFFFTDTPIDSIKVDGVNYKKPYDIFKAKKKIGRIKDWGQLKRIANSIFSQKELDDCLNKVV